MHRTFRFCVKMMGLVIAIGLAAPPTIVCAQVRSYASPLMIPAADFSDNGFANDGYEFWPAVGYVRGLGFHNLKAAAYLPDGVTVTGVTAILHDNVDSNMQVAMFRCSRTTGSVNQMTLIYSSNSASIQEEPNPGPISYPVIASSDYWYYVVVEFGAANQRLYGVRIDYTE